MTLDMERIVPGTLGLLFALGLALIWRYPIDKKGNWIWTFIPIMSGSLFFCLLGVSMGWSMVITHHSCFGVYVARYFRDRMKAKREASRKGGDGGADSETPAAPENAAPAPAAAPGQLQS